MREYEVVVTREAENQLREYIDYILHTFKSEQAADAVWSDAMETMNQLTRIAGSIPDMTKPGFEGYKRINFLHHNYAIIYRVDNGVAYVERIFHQSQDIDNNFI